MLHLLNPSAAMTMVKIKPSSLRAKFVEKRAYHRPYLMFVCGVSVLIVTSLLAPYSLWKSVGSTPVRDVAFEEAVELREAINAAKRLVRKKSSGMSATDLNPKWRNQVRFFLLGAAKSGTTSLHSYIVQHPLILAPKTKETRCLTSAWDESYPDCANWYNTKKLLSDPAFITGESSVDYMITPTPVISRIKDNFPNARFVLTLREPIERLYSQYQQISSRPQTFKLSLTELVQVGMQQLYRAGLLPHFCNMPDSPTLWDWVSATIDMKVFNSFHGSPEQMEAWHRYIVSNIPGDERTDTDRIKATMSASFYSVHLQEWFKAYDRSRFLILRPEEMTANLTAVMHHVFDHLQVPHVDIKNQQKRNVRRQLDQLMKSDNAVAIRVLQKLFAPYNEALHQLLQENDLDDKWKNIWTYPTVDTVLTSLPDYDIPRSLPIAVLHVGPRKTATTAIQHFLETNADDLKQDNYYHLGRYVMDKSTPAFFEYDCFRIYARTCMPEEQCNPHHDCIEKFIQRIQYHRRKGHNIIISEEMYQVASAEKEYNSRLLEDLFMGFDVRVVVSYRRYHEWIRSEYDQRHKSRLDGSPRAWKELESFESWYQLNRTRKQLRPLDQVSLDLWRRFRNTHVFNMHESDTDVLTRFVCECIPNANTTCEKAREGALRPPSDSNLSVGSLSFYANKLYKEAKKKGLAVPFVPYDMVKKAIMDYLDQKMAQLIFDCPEENLLQEILAKSIEIESYVVPDFHSSENGQSILKSTFTKAVKENKFCDIDTGKMLEDEALQNALLPRGKQEIRTESYAVDLKTFPCAYVFILGGVGYDDPSLHRSFLYNILISASVLRERGTMADLVLYVQVSSSSPANSLIPEEERWLRFFDVDIRYLKKANRESIQAINMAKPIIFNMTEYSRVLFLDGDVLVLGNLDYLFEKSLSGTFRGNVMVPGKMAPMNGGFALITPGNFSEIKNLVSSKFGDNVGRSMDKYAGWGHIMAEDDRWINRDGEIKGHFWDFNGAKVDQGFFYYWLKYVIKDVTILIKGYAFDWGIDNTTGKAALVDVSNAYLEELSKPIYRWKDVCSTWWCDFYHPTGKMNKIWREPLPADFDIHDKEQESRSILHFWFHRLAQLDDRISMGINVQDWAPVYQKPLLEVKNGQLVSTDIVPSNEGYYDYSTSPTWTNQVRFLLLGVSKCGTTSMHNYIVQHPQILKPYAKEPSCLAVRWKSADPACKANFNVKALQQNNSLVTGESTAEYLMFGSTITRRVKFTFPKAKFVVVIREPIGRTYSYYQMLQRRGKFPGSLTFSQAVEIGMQELHKGGLLSYYNDMPEVPNLSDWEQAEVDHEKFAKFDGSKEQEQVWSQLLSDIVTTVPKQRTLEMNLKAMLAQSIYSVPLRQWLNTFDRSRFLIIQTDRMKANLTEVMLQVHDHLELSYVPVKNEQEKNAHPYNPLAQESLARLVLQKLFKPYNEALSLLISDRAKEASEWSTLWAY